MAKRLIKGVDYCGKKKSPKGVCILDANHDGICKDFKVTVMEKVFGVTLG